MDLKELPKYINSRLKEHSLAHVSFKEGFFQDSVVIYDGFHTITITKEFGIWYLRYRYGTDGDLLIYMEIQESMSGDLSTIIHFVNENTVHETPEEEIANELEPSSENEEATPLETETIK